MAPQWVTLGVLLAGIVLLGTTFYQVVAPFLLPLFLAAILAILCRPLFLRLLDWSQGRRALAAGFTTALVTLIFVAPLVVVTLLGTAELGRLAQGELQHWDWSRGLETLWRDVLEPTLRQIEERFPGRFDVEQIKQNLADNSENIVQSVTKRTILWASSTVGMFVSLLVSGGMFLVAFYYFLADGPELITTLETLLPVPVEHQRQLRDQFSKVVRAVVLATFLAAFAQGIATAIALQVVGMGHFFVFLIAATMASLIPLAGTWMVWGPCALWLAVQGHWGAALGLSLFGMIVVGLLDNVVRTYILNSDAELHPLLAFVSVLGALQVMGLWGIFIGPIVASCLYALVQIFNAEVRRVGMLVSQPAPTSSSVANPPPNFPLTATSRVLSSGTVVSPAEKTEPLLPS